MECDIDNDAGAAWGYDRQYRGYGEWCV